MVDLKADFSGGLNLDDSYYAVPKNSYVDALNITRDAISGSNDRAITNIFGNRIIQKTKSTLIRVDVPGEYEDVIIGIETDPVSSNTRSFVILNLQPSNTPVKILDYTSTEILSKEDYATAAINSMYSSIDTATGIVIQDGNITPGTYNNVTQSSTSGIGFDAVFNVVIGASNVVTAVTIVDGGLNYKVNDTITIPGSQFGGIDGTDDVIITALTFVTRNGVLLAFSSSNEINFRYNLDTGIGLNYYSWGSYSVSVGSQTTGYTCIGAYANQTRNTIIYFLYQSQGYHIILEYNIDTEIITKILESKIDSSGIDILNFDLQNKITSINVFNRDEGDLLFFLDTLGRPTGLNIELFKNNEYVPVTRDIIDVCKRPPLNPPQVSYINDTNTLSNNLRGKFFRFKYRYVYDDLSKSVCSPISIMPLPLNILNTEYVNKTTNNNCIKLSYSSGDKDVNKIELLMSFVNNTNDWSDFQIVETLEKKLKYNFSIQPIVNTTDNLIKINFGGVAVPYAIVSVYFNDLSLNYEYLEAQDIISETDTINSFVQNLFSSAITFTGSAVGNSMTLIFDPALWSFSRITIEYQLGTDNLIYNYLFYNDSTYPLLDINESIQLFDYVPELANAQELANGNVLLYGGITEGYNKDLIPNVLVNISTYPSEVGGTTSGNLTIDSGEYDKNYGFIIPNYRHGVYYTLTGSPPINTLIEIFVKDQSNNQILLTQYTTVNDFETASSIVGNLLANIIPSVFDSGRGIEPGYYRQTSFYVIFLQSATYFLDNVKITFPLGNLGIDNPYKTFLNSSSRNIGIAYFDQKGKTNGILWNEKITFPDYAESSNKTLLPQIDLTINHTPPIWSYSYQIYLTKPSNNVLCWAALVIKTEPDYLYFDISSIKKQQELYPTTAKVCSWSFQEGDRIKVLKNITDNIVLSPELDGEIIGIIENPTVNGNVVQGVTYLKIPRKGVFATQFTGSNNDQKRYYIQLYRQFAPDNKEIYYEFGQQYDVLFPGTANRSHSGLTQNQNTNASFGAVVPALVNIKSGDIYFRQRILYFPGSTTISSQNLFVYDYNVTDNYTSAVNDIMGRPNTIDKEAKRTYFPTLIRYSQAYQPNTNINGLPRFFFANFDEYDYNYGDIKRFKTRDRFIRVFQRLKVGMVPLYQQMVKNQGTETLVISDKLLNPIQYYNGDVGIGDNPESLASYTYADYFTSNIKGIIGRVSQDGVEFLSITNKVNSWANEQVGDVAKRFMIGCFDQRLSNYILHLTASNNKQQVTIVYDQEYGNFESFLTLYPDMMASLGVTLASFKNGEIYIHNNSPYNTFFGLPPAESSITPVFNESPYQKKTFLGLSEVASTTWDCPVVSTDSISYGTNRQTTVLVAGDFKQLEGTYEVPMLRDIYSIGGIINGDTMKGKYLVTKFRKASASSLITLNIVSCKYIDSPLTNR